MKNSKSESNENSKADKMAITWYYDSQDTYEGAFSVATNWSIGGPVDCVVIGTRPCHITVPASDYEELDDFLSGMSNSDVLNLDLSRKE